VRLPALREELGADFCVVNGENAADGRGITAKLAERILAAGADVITLGNHTWAQRDFAPYLSGTERVIRPANLSARTPGRGLTVQPAADGTPVAVINLLGQLYLDPAAGPFEVAEGLVEEALRTTPVVIVDFHAEATSEKIALARLLDGRATAVIGTHTHVQTADEQILAGGTAFITDVGMTGPHDSVIGMRKDLVLSRFVTGLPESFKPATSGVQFQAALVTADAASGKASRIERIGIPVAE
jgi:metallophosphoesterase (TIGR00282 family)